MQENVSKNIQHAQNLQKILYAKNTLKWIVSLKLGIQFYNKSEDRKREWTLMPQTGPYTIKKIISIKNIKQYQKGKSTNSASETSIDDECVQTERCRIKRDILTQFKNTGNSGLCQPLNYINFKVIIILFCYLKYFLQ